MANPELLEMWIEIAEKDLLSAKKLLLPPDPQFENALYHCQQCAEKATKALILLNGESPPRTHDITQLINILSEYYVGLNIFLINNKSNLITEFGVRFRYPTYPKASDKPLTEAYVADLIGDAENFFTQAKEQVNHYVSQSRHQDYPTEK